MVVICLWNNTFVGMSLSLYFVRWIMDAHYWLDCLFFFLQLVEGELAHYEVKITQLEEEVCILSYLSYFACCMVSFFSSR